VVMRHSKRLLVLTGLVGLVTVARAAPARARCSASVKKKIARLNKSAMEDYDLLEFESSKQSLLDAQRIARVEGCDTDPINAKTYTNLAVLYIQGFKDEDRGRLMFRRALSISKHINLDRQVATPKLLRIFAQVRKEMGLSGGGDEAARTEATVTPPSRPRPVARPIEPEKPAKGFEHSPIDEAPRSTPLEVTCRLGDDIGANRVILFYKHRGQADYTAVPMKKVSHWTWKSTIPASDMVGPSLYYYLEARKGEKPMAASGNAASPYIIALTNPPRRAGGEPTENPFSEGSGKHEENKGGGHKTSSGKKGKGIGLYMSLGGGLHFGYIGSWYGDLSAQKPGSPGFALGTFDGRVEAGYFINPVMLVSLDFSLGYALSDRSEQAVLGWQVLGRFRYVALGGRSHSPFRLYVGGELGGGVAYHSLTLKGGRDSFESGPGLILGALVGFWLGSSTVSWFLELDPKAVIDMTTSTTNVEGGTTIEHPKQHTFTIGLTTGVAFRF